MLSTKYWNIYLGVSSLLLLGIQPAAAENKQEILKRGSALYQTYCSACHAADGKGANNGAFPPLAGSNWLKGSPERAIQVVLHGLEGEIAVNRRQYALAMPPQGSALSDQQIADILSFVRSSWGNKEAIVTSDLVTKGRQQTDSRDKPWTQQEISKLYGLPIQKSPHIKDTLIMSTYQGKWDKLPDFSKLKAEAVEEEHSGYISLQSIHEEKNFGVVWEGEILANTDHTYGFTLECTDGARLVINDKEVIRMANTSAKIRKKTGGMSLKRGWHKVRLEYYNSSGDPQLRLYMGIGEQSLISDPLARKLPEKIMLKPEQSMARLYKHFVKGATPYTLSVAYPNGVNLAYDTASCSPVIMWKGDFIDASRHWVDRGKGWQPVASAQQTLFKPQTNAVVTQFTGYQLDKSNYPTFHYTISGKVKVSDSFQPTETGFVRKITYTNSSTPLDLPLHLSPAGGKPMEIHDGASKEIPGTITIKQGVSTITINYTWKSNEQIQ